MSTILCLFRLYSLYKLNFSLAEIYSNTLTKIHPNQNWEEHSGAAANMMDV